MIKLRARIEIFAYSKNNKNKKSKSQACLLFANELNIKYRIISFVYIITFVGSFEIIPTTT